MRFLPKFKRKETICDRLVAAERAWLDSLPHPQPEEPTSSSARGLSKEDEAKYHRLLTLLRFPLDDLREPSPEDLEALSEGEKERLEQMRIQAIWDAFLVSQGAPLRIFGTMA